MFNPYTFYSQPSQSSGANFTHLILGGNNHFAPSPDPYTFPFSSPQQPQPHLQPLHHNHTPYAHPPTLQGQQHFFPTYQQHQQHPHQQDQYQQYQHQRHQQHQHQQCQQHHHNHQQQSPPPPPPNSTQYQSQQPRMPPFPNPSYQTRDQKSKMKKDFMEGVHDLYIQLQGTLPRYDLSPLGNEAGGQGTSAVIDEGEMAAGAAVLGAAGAAVLTEVNDSNTTEASNNLSPDDINPHNAPVQGDADSQQRHQQSCIGNKAPHIQPEGHKFNPALDPLPHAQDRGQGIPIPSSPFPTRRQSL